MSATEHGAHCSQISMCCKNIHARLCLIFGNEIYTTLFCIYSMYKWNREQGEKRNKKINCSVFIERLEDEARKQLEGESKSNVGIMKF